MSQTTVAVRVILLIEDNPADADIVEELLGKAPEEYRICHVTRVADALERLRAVSEQNPIDAVLLDLRLPDAKGRETVQFVRAVTRDIPIVVLTSLDDEDLALTCIREGAQDYLSKNDLRTTTLRRAIGYAISRMQEAQLHELRETFAQYHAMSSAGSSTQVTGALAHSGAVHHHAPNVFEEIILSYVALMDAYLEQLVFKKAKPRADMERIITRLGDAGGGPRDLIDLHTMALDRAIAGHSAEHIRSLAVEGRLLALEMMGLLVDYYRVGHRRMFTSEKREAG